MSSVNTPGREEKAENITKKLEEKKNTYNVKRITSRKQTLLFLRCIQTEEEMKRNDISIHVEGYQASTPQLGQKIKEGK